MPKIFVSAPTHQPVLAEAAHRYADQLAQQVGSNFIRQRHILHLTVRYVGEISRLQADELLARVGEMARRHRPVSLRAGPLDMFENNDAVFARVQGALPALRQLRADVDSAVNAIGGPPAEFELNPHITIGRAARGQERAVREALAVIETEPVPFWLTETAVYESVPVDGNGSVLTGSAYVTNGTFALGAR